MDSCREVSLSARKSRVEGSTGLLGGAGMMKRGLVRVGLILSLVPKDEDSEQLASFIFYSPFAMLSFLFIICKYYYSLFFLNTG
jgi:hypothetical protein